MSGADTGPGSGATLRRKAEARLQHDAEDLSGLPADQARRLVHELRVHQTELEVQNEELQRAQDELQRARDRYAELYDFAPVGYLATDSHGIIREANLTLASQLGVGRAVLVDQPLSRFVAEQDQDTLYLQRHGMVDGAARAAFDLRLRRLDQTMFWASLDCRAVTDASGAYQGCRIAITDISERRRLEEELIRLERLRAAGELSAGVSHNLNNMLTTVLGPALLLRRKTDDPRLLLEVDTIVAAAERARDLVHELHASVRCADDVQLQAVPLQRAVPEALQGCRPRWKDEPEARGISIAVESDLGEVPAIRGTEAGVHHIITNLVLNAVDAMPHGGQIRVRAQAAGDAVSLQCSDTGLGMDRETARRVFEPFFTTKAELGTGLGLATVYNTVAAWGGTIDVTSTPGEGTTFRLRLPAWQGVPATLAGAPQDKPQPRSSRLLIVDDDETTCSLLRRLLQEDQHELDTATNAHVALQRMARGKYDVVLLDLGLPDIPGDRLLRELRCVDPNVAAVLITGWELEADDPRRQPFDFVITKPIDDIEGLQDIVARAAHLRDGRAGAPSSTA